MTFDGYLDTRPAYGSSRPRRVNQPKGLILRALLSLSRDADAINAVLNHPEVRPFLGPMDAGELDFSPLMDCPEHLFPFGEFGGFALIWTAPHTREVHTFFLPEGRGKWAAQARDEGIAMARAAGTKTLWTRIPPNSPHVRAFAVAGGMEPTGETINLLGVPYEIYSMEIPTCQP